MKTGRPPAKPRPRAMPAPPVVSTDPDPDLPKALTTDWRNSVADLTTIGALINTDIIQLRDAFLLRANALAFQELLDSSLTDPEMSPSDRTKYNGAVNSARAAAWRIIGDLEIQIARRPVKDPPKKGADIEDFRP